MLIFSIFVKIINKKVVIKISYLLFVVVKIIDDIFIAFQFRILPLKDGTYDSDDLRDVLQVSICHSNILMSDCEFIVKLSTNKISKQKITIMFHLYLDRFTLPH